METQLEEFWATFFLSMAPVVELRGGLPYGIAQDLPYPVALVAAVLGNMVPVPFIIVYIRRVFNALRKSSRRLRHLVERLEQRARLKSHVVNKYRYFGLFVLVAIPLPGTGAWTGALVAAFLNMRLKSAVPAIFLGVCFAAAIMTALTFGVAGYLE